MEFLFFVTFLAVYDVFFKIMILDHVQMHYGCRVVVMQLIVAAMHYGLSAIMHCKRMEK